METVSFVSQGFELAIIGMGTVFLFLTTLILVTRLMSSIVLKFDTGDDIVTASSATHSDSMAEADQGRLIAIITAAIAEHRNSRS